jgi:hypothetical protein
VYEALGARVDARKTRRVRDIKKKQKLELAAKLARKCDIDTKAECGMKTCALAPGVAAAAGVGGCVACAETDDLNTMLTKLRRESGAATQSML